MRAESINKIIEKSTRLFAEKGFFKCKMTEIAGAAGMSVGNLYWYYKSNPEISYGVIPGAGHDAMFTSPGESNEALRPFLCWFE